MIALFYSGTYEHRVPAVSVRSFKAACGFPEDAEGRSAVRHAPGLRGVQATGRGGSSIPPCYMRPGSATATLPFTCSHQSRWCALPTRSTLPNDGRLLPRFSASFGTSPFRSGVAPIRISRSPSTTTCKSGTPPFDRSRTSCRALQEVSRHAQPLGAEHTEQVEPSGTVVDEVTEDPKSAISMAP
jgi:hypothetical protein